MMSKARFMSAKQAQIPKGDKAPSNVSLPQHHSGKGTRARLNTAAEKMFSSQRSV